AGLSVGVGLALAAEVGPPGTWPAACHSAESPDSASTPIARKTSARRTVPSVRERRGADRGAAALVGRRAAAGGTRVAWTGTTIVAVSAIGSGATTGPGSTATSAPVDRPRAATRPAVNAFNVGRWAGASARPAPTTSSKDPESLGLTSETRGIGSAPALARVVRESARRGARPVRAWNVVAARAYTSLAVVAAPPRTSSGAMYAGVP